MPPPKQILGYAPGCRPVYF